MTEKEAENFIEELQGYGSVPGLDSICELCRRLGNPQDALSFVHIAGTNGKGSILLLVSEACREAKIRVGRYISPTISDYRERFQINSRMITKKALYSYLERLKEVCDKMVEAGFRHPTSFEVETALAFLYFKEQNCDLVVLEAGMGGLGDATNLITTTKVAVLASISMDHMAFLGKSLKEIAHQKAGIIKEGARVVAYPSPKEALEEIERMCLSQNISDNKYKVTDASAIMQPKYGLAKQSFSYGAYKKMELGLIGKHQLVNASVALDVIDALREAGYEIPEVCVRKAFREAKWPGRMEIIAKKPYFVLDGAHNEDAARKLAESIRFYFTNRRIIYIMGILKDKEYEKIIALTHSFADQIITVKTPNNQRAMDAYELAREVSAYHSRVTAVDSLEEAVEVSYLLADKDTVILAFGSLSFLGDLKKIVEVQLKERHYGR